MFSTMNISWSDIGVSTARRAAIHPDQVLMVSIRQGDERALGRLYDRHVDRMLGLACHILSNQSDAEDVIHDVFVEVWHKANTYDPKRGNVLAWLLLRVRSRSLDRIRSLNTVRKHLMSHSVESDKTEDQSMASVDEAHQREHLRKALETLPEKQRSVIELSYFKGLSCSEIARHCNIPVGTVKTRMMAAVNKLRNNLQHVEVF